MVLGNEVVVAQETQDPEEEEDLVDPMDTIRDECKVGSACAKLQERLTECNDRVNSKETTPEVCTEELFDFVHCLDHCVSGKVFSTFNHYMEKNWMTGKSRACFKPVVFGESLYGDDMDDREVAGHPRQSI
ncbi:hypothetical protein ScPMuIL_000077 [Solemya velum]